MRETKDIGAKKDYALPNTDYIYFPFCYYLRKIYIYIFCGATVSSMLIISSAVPSYVVPSEVPWDGDLLWLLFCIC